MAKPGLIQRIRAQLAQHGITQLRNSASKSWIQKLTQLAALNIGARRAFVNASNASNSTGNITPDKFIGNVVLFFYDAKLKKKLPYWDKFPVVIPIEIYNDGFLGLNLHYLNPSDRAKLLGDLDHILRTSTGIATNRISYSYLKHATSIIPKEAKPCIKKYLYTHIVGKYLPINPEDWEIIIFLPWEEFSSTKGPITKQQVWQDSQAQY